MPVDKGMCKNVTMRFSLLNPDHVRLLEKMEQECRQGGRSFSKNKLIIQCIEEHYAMLESGQAQGMLEQRLKSYVDGEVQKIKQEIGMRIYRDVFQMFASGLAAAGNQWKPAASEIRAEQPEEPPGHTDSGEVDLSENADMMDDIMKWS
ncbi:MAG: hypothetical protein NC348_13865 [Clostridium sp.]|nr:hypothetical protein [Clostridium sp.]